MKVHFIKVGIAPTLGLQKFQSAQAKQRKEARDRKLEAYKNLDPMQKLAMNPPSPAAIAQAREQWGITGEPTY